MSDYLTAHPGIPQKIVGKTYLIKWMYSEKSDAESKIDGLKKEGKYREIRLYPRKIKGRLFGKHPWCIGITEK